MIKVLIKQFPQSLKQYLLVIKDSFVHPMMQPNIAFWKSERYLLFGTIYLVTELMEIWCGIPETCSLQ
jgi:hypothetical protein